MSRYNHTRYQSNDRQSEARSYSPARYNASNDLSPENHSIRPRPADKSIPKKSSKPSPPPAKSPTKLNNQPPGKLIQDAYPPKKDQLADSSATVIAGTAKPEPKRSNVLHRSSVTKPNKSSETFHKNINNSDKERKKPLFSWRFIGASVTVLVVVGGLGSLAAILFHSMPNNQSEEVLSEQIARTSATQTEQSAHVSEELVSDSDKENHQVADHEPKRASVDHVDIDARIYRAGVNRHNQLIMPSNVHDVNWYEGSRAPGNRGAVLLSGYVSGPTERGALYYTRALEHGDIITVINGDGTEYEYEVVKREFVPYDEVDVYSLLVPYERGKNTLHIIAADDRYNVMNNGFQDRLVIYAVEVE